MSGVVDVQLADVPGGGGKGEVRRNLGDILGAVITRNAVVRAMRTIARMVALVTYSETGLPFSPLLRVMKMVVKSAAG